MAVTGILLVGFVLVHMLGNLQLFAGDGGKALDAYAETLHNLLGGNGIWIARALLVTAVGLHIWAAASLTLMNRRARPVDYAAHAYKESTLASRWMRLSGIIVAAFIIFHLLHFTTGTLHPNYIQGHVFDNVVRGFQVRWVAAFYILSMLALAPHLAHGIWSMLQTLGLSHPNFDAQRKIIAGLITFLVVGANIAFPLSVQLGYVMVAESVVSIPSSLPSE